MTALKKVTNSIQTKIESSKLWLTTVTTSSDVVGAKAIQRIIAQSEQFAEKCLPNDAQKIRNQCAIVSEQLSMLCHLRISRNGQTPKAIQLATETETALDHLDDQIKNAVKYMDKTIVQSVAHLLEERVQQACRWLENPEVEGTELGQLAIDLIVHDGDNVEDLCSDGEKNKIHQNCNEVANLSNRFLKLCEEGNEKSPAAREYSVAVVGKLGELKTDIQNALVYCVADVYMNESAPLKNFITLVNGNPEKYRDNLFIETAKTFQLFNNKLAKISRMVALGGSETNKPISEELTALANQLDAHTPQIIRAGRIRLNYPMTDIGETNFLNLQQEYERLIFRMRALCDEAIDPKQFVLASEDLMLKFTKLCDVSIQNEDMHTMVEMTSNIARIMHRVAVVAKQESDNSEDKKYVSHLCHAITTLENNIPKIVLSAKEVVANVHNLDAIAEWRQNNQNLFDSVQGITKILNGTTDSTSQFSSIDRKLQINDTSLQPSSVDGFTSSLGGTATAAGSVEKGDEIFNEVPAASEPIMVAAHGLHQLVRHWRSEDNDLITTVKQMVILMAHLSSFVTANNTKSSKREFITTANLIADASERVCKLTRELLPYCTNKRIKANLEHACDRIPTIGTQLKILTTVKATTLGASVSDQEDCDATDMLITNAQNLMKAIRGAVVAAESVSIDVRTNPKNKKLSWVRRVPHTFNK